MNLNISIGKTPNDNNEVFLDLAKDTIHTIVFSGMTGSGKSTFHHNVTKQIMKNNTTEEVGFIFMDFKVVEFGEYKKSSYLQHPIVYDPKEAVTILNDLINESEQRFKSIKDAKKAIIVHIEECDIVYAAPGLLERVWKTIDEQSEKNNIYVFFSSSKVSNDVFTPELLRHTKLRGMFSNASSVDTSFDIEEVNRCASRILGQSLKILPEPWTRIFQLRGGKEIICKGYI